MSCEQEDDLDARLHDAFSSRLPDTSKIELSVRKRIAAESLRRLIAISTGVAAAILIVILGYWHRTPQLFKEAARDHRIEVTEHKPRHWRSSDADIAALTRPYSLPIAPAGYRLEHAKICGLERGPVLHLVYTNGAREFSVYIRQRGGSSLPGGAFAVGPEHITAFQTGRFDALVVMDASNADCLKLAKQISRLL